MAYYVYAGTYTGGAHSDLEITGSRGIYLYRVEEDTNGLLPLGVYGHEEIDPAFLAVKGDLLFAEHERKDFQVLCSYQICGDGSLIPAGRIYAAGSKCAHVCLDPIGNYVVGAGYASGTVVVARYAQDGSLTRTDLVVHEGKSIIPRRQESPHAHSARFTPGGNGLLVPDLGIDKVMNYDFDRHSGRLSLNTGQPYIQVEEGEGPRHLIFHPELPLAYLLTEIGNHIYVYHYYANDRTFCRKQVISVLPEDFYGVSHSAELIISSDGRFLYSSNRGHDSISAFLILPETGTLELIGCFGCGGKGPRHICFGIAERALIVANKDSDELCVVERDQNTGKLGRVCSRRYVPAPACVVLNKKE